MDLRKNLIERRMVELDPELARHYLKFNVYETQRTLRPAHVTDLASKMVSGLFRFGEIAFACRNADGDLLMNGQHVCSAVIESGMTVPCLVEKFKILNDLELSELFRQFEILPRSLNDMIKVEANSLSLSWPIRMSALIVSAAAIEYVDKPSLYSGSGTGSKNPGKKTLTRDQKVGLLSEYLKEGAFLSSIITDMGSQRHLARASVAYMIFKTYRINKSVAFNFWCKVRDGENLTRDMPEMKIREFLIMSAMKSTISKPSSVSNHEYCYRIAQAWNASVNGTSTRLNYYHDKPIPRLAN